MLDPVTDAAIVAAGIALAQQIMTMIANRAAATKEEHEAILAKLVAADKALSSAADAAHASLSADLAADAAALAKP
jgi:hypothetical protein